MENVINHAAEKTMAWYWTRPILSGNMNFDAGAGNDTSLSIAQMIASNIASNERDKIDNTIIKKFYNKLVEKIIDDNITHLDCDYGPCIELSEIAKECGISNSLFSWKTYTFIENGKVFAKSGYGHTVNMIPLLKEDPVF